MKEHLTYPVGTLVVYDDGITRDVGIVVGGYRKPRGIAPVRVLVRFSDPEMAGGEGAVAHISPEYLSPVGGTG